MADSDWTGRQVEEAVDLRPVRRAEALVHGSGEELAWSLSMRRSDSTNGYWLCDTDHAVEDMDGDSDFAALSVV